MTNLPDQIFDIEKLQKQFFDSFVDCYHLLVKDLTGAANEAAAGQLAQSLLEKLLFLCFIQKKGWLAGQADYLFSEFNARHRRNPLSNSYYGSLLKPLLINLSGMDSEQALPLPVPILKGTFFEDIDTGAGELSSIQNRSFAFIFDRLLGRYKFTIAEDARFNQAVAIDPEMLGTIFERLVLQRQTDPAGSLRKLSGSYYTPRTIVAYMCRESLRYLLANSKTTRNCEGRDWFGKVSRLIDLPPPEHLNDHEHQILSSLFSPSQAESLKERLLAARVLDPAVGSGAFLVGMLHQLVSAIGKLDVLIEGPAAIKRTNYKYELKKLIIRSCLYGVDIQEQAVKLCQLRLWLSLIVDFELDNNKPLAEALLAVPPLPDLSDHVLCADSLLQQPFAQDRQGFDVVIANPPYRTFGLRGNKNAEADWKAQAAKLFPGSFQYKPNPYVLFFELALRHATRGGIVCFLTPDSFLLGMYSEKLRNTILRLSSIKKILQLEKDFWQSGTVGRPTITILEKGGSKGEVEAALALDHQAILTGKIKSYAYSETYFQEIPLHRFRLFFTPIAKQFVEQVERASMPLSALATIKTGVRSKIGQDKIKSKEKQGPNWKRGITDSTAVKPYTRVPWQGDYLHIDPAILWAGGFDPQIVENSKLMIRQTGDSIITGLDDNGLYHLNNVHSLAPLHAGVSLKFLCALLNSRLMNRYYRLISLEFGRAMAQTDIETLELLPLRHPASTVLAEVEALFDTVEQDPSAVARLNQIIEALYELSDELIAYLKQPELYPEDQTAAHTFISNQATMAELVQQVAPQASLPR